MKKQINNSEYFYFKTSLNYIIKNQVVLCVIFFLEYLPIYFSLIYSACKLQNGRKLYEENTSIFYYISIYGFYKEYVPTFDPIFIYVFISVFICIIVCYNLFKMLLAEALIDNKHFLIEWFKLFMINFLEIFSMRLLNLFIVDSNVTVLVKLVFEDINKTPDNMRIFAQLAMIILALASIVSLVLHFKNVCIWSNIKLLNGNKTNNSYPFDMKFSLKYDLILLSIKVIVALEKNLYLSNDKFLTIEILFFDLLGIVIIMFYFVYLVYLIVFNPNDILYYQITNVNLMKIFLILFTGLSLIFRFIISNDKSEIYYFVNAVSLALFVLFFLEQFKKRLYEIFVKSNDMIGLLIYLISNNNDDTLLINQWLINHKIKCKTNECLYCKELFRTKNDTQKGEVIDNLSLERFYKIVWSILTQEIKNSKLKLTKDKEVYVDGIELVYYLIQKSHQRLKFNIIFYKKLVKYVSLNRTFYNNLQLLFERVKELNMDFIKCYQNFEESKLVVNEFTTLFISLDNFMKYEGKTHENVIKLSKKLDDFTSNSSVIKKLTSSLGNYSYELFLLRYIFELITHQSLKGTFELFDITNYYDFIDYHFTNDNIILINYGLIAQECIIIKACTELRKYINFSFDEIFPRYVKQFGKAEFIKLINQTNFKDEKNNFNFVLQNLNDDNVSFVELFQLKFMMFPSIDKGEVLISGELVQKVSDVMIFSTINQREFLVSFSSSMEKVFCINPEIIEIFAVNQKVLFIDAIFKNKKLASLNIRDKFKEKHYSINFNNYYNTLKQYLSDIEDIQEKDSILNKLIQIKTMLANKIFSLTNLYTIKNNNGEEYIIYSVHYEEIIDNNQLTKTKQGCDSLLKDTFTKYMTTTVGQDKGSNASSSYQSLNKLNIRMHNKIKGDQFDIKDYIKLKSINGIYWCYNFIILLFTIIFLITQLRQNNNFIRYFNLYQLYINFRTELDVQILRLSSHFCIAPSLLLPTVCTNYFNQYSKKYLAKGTTNEHSILMSSFVYLEFVESLGYIQSRYLKYQTEFYQLSSDDQSKMADQLMEITYINIEEGKNLIRKENETFYQGLNIYINFMTQIVNENAVSTIPIQFFNYDGSENFLETGRNGKRQKNLYQILLNYPTIQRILTEKDLIILSWYEIYRFNIIRYLIAFTITNIILLNFHFILGTYSQVICSKVINNTIDLIISKLKSKTYMEYFQSKYRKMKTLLDLYKEKPSVVIISIIKDTEEYKQKENEKKKELEAIAQYQTIPQKKQKNPTSTYDKSIKRTHILSYAIYVFLFVFEIGLFFIMNNSYNLMKTLVLLSYHNSNIDYYLYNSLNSLQYILITNITEYQLSAMIHRNGSIPFVQQAVNEHLYSIKILDSIRAEQSDLFNQFFNVINFSCEMIRQTNDTLLNHINSLNDTDYCKYIEELCHDFSIMGFNDSNLIQTNIIYLEQKLINSYTKVPYEKKVELISNDVLWELYSTLLIFNRIIRQAMNDLVMPNVIRVMTNRLNSTFQGCLISNIFIEFGLVAILFYLTFIFLMQTNKKIMILLRFLEGA